MKTLLSLFDYSGVWGEPFFGNGWDVIPWDINRSEFMDINLLSSAEKVLDMFQNVDAVLAAPPCTDFTVSGSQYWPQKDANGTTAISVELVNQVLRLVDLFRPTDPEYDGVFFWAMENPVGRIQTLFPHLERPMYFNPFEFAGYLNPTKKELRELDRIRKKDGKDVTWEETDLVIRLNAYTKKTGLWGEFNREMVKKIIPPVKCAPQGSFTQRYGGKSVETKEARSNTPLGFAQAFYEANKDHSLSADEILVSC